MYRRILKNNTALPIELTVLGFTIEPSESIEIARMAYTLLGNENAEKEWLPHVLSGDILVSDGEIYLPVRAAIGLLKSNPEIIQEYYALTQDDDILIGNGQILYLHAEDWDYFDEGYEDDVPTQG